MEFTQTSLTPAVFQDALSSDNEYCESKLASQARGYPAKFTPQYYENLVSRAFDKYTAYQDEMLRRMIYYINTARRQLDNIIAAALVIDEENKRLEAQLNFLGENDSYNQIIHFQYAIEGIRSSVARASQKLQTSQLYFQEDYAVNARTTQEMNRMDVQIIAIIDQLRGASVPRGGSVDSSDHSFPGAQ